ncbi:hypothetical protein GF336_05405 [Candidatus Woesearchaeota archaeon]|nr:hypothetical protein [Candidatus Woesearchaeota archaeon]
MPCRVGMTTDLDARKKYWETVYNKIWNWTVSGPYATREEAQKQETFLALLHKCESGPGGDDPDNPLDDWYVYRFQYDRKK